jgi:hypothetical protein
MKRIAALVWLLASLSLTIHAQSPNASLRGSVTDPSKAVLVDARIHAINLGTNISYEGATNSAMCSTFVWTGHSRISISRTPW